MLNQKTKSVIKKKKEETTNITKPLDHEVYSFSSFSSTVISRVCELQTQTKMWCKGFPAPIPVTFELFQHQDHKVEFQIKTFMFEKDASAYILKDISWKQFGVSDYSVIWLIKLEVDCVCYLKKKTNSEM